MPPITIVIAAANPLSLAQLMGELTAVPGVHICGQAGDLSGTYVLVEQQEPRLVLLGPELVRHPEFDGLLSMFRVMGTRWMQIGSDAGATLHSHRGPILDPALPAAQIATAIETILLRTPPASPTQPTQRPPVAPLSGLRSRADRFILIGSSTGGIDALLRVLSVFPADCPPTAIVQHTGSAFSDSLIRLLDRCSAANVVPARAEMPMQQGQIIVGAGCCGHLRLLTGTPLRAAVQPGDPVAGHLPSVDELFRSGVGLGRNVAAALLTGMGKDGAQGMLALRQAGACTIAQDEATSVVYGMPRAAWEIGAAQTRLPLDRIGPELLARTSDRPMPGATDRTQEVHAR